MAARERDMRIPSELIPTCPHCGSPAPTNLRADDKFVEDEGWHQAAGRYVQFLRTRRNMLFVTSAPTRFPDSR